jgi:hypothetical protein
VVDPQAWLNRQQVLISAISLRRPDWDARLLPVAITQQQVRNSPDIDTDMPVSRQHERDYLGYYGYPVYWGGAGMWGEVAWPYPIEPADPTYGLTRFERDRALQAWASDKQAQHRHDDPHLRSAKVMNGYHIHASDGDIGHVEDLLVDDTSWAIRYLVVNTSNWWIGHKVLIAPHDITGVHWSDESVTITLSREAIKAAPPYDSTDDLNRAVEARDFAQDISALQRPPAAGAGRSGEQPRTSLR